MTEALWRGSFGDSYTERNADAGKDRGPFWEAMLKSLSPHGSILEVGCNVGANLQHFPDTSYTYGVDINAEAIRFARERFPLMHLSEASVSLRLPFHDAMFGLVVTCGVLIHIAPDDLHRAIREVFRVSRKAVLIMEYQADKETAIPYRGQDAALWKRNWFYEMQEARLEQQWQMTWRCPLGLDQGFDDVTAYLWERKG